MSILTKSLNIGGGNSASVYYDVNYSYSNVEYNIYYHYHFCVCVWGACVCCIWQAYGGQKTTFRFWRSYYMPRLDFYRCSSWSWESCTVFLSLWKVFCCRSCFVMTECRSCLNCFSVFVDSCQMLDGHLVCCYYAPGYARKFLWSLQILLSSSLPFKTLAFNFMRNVSFNFDYACLVLY